MVREATNRQAVAAASAAVTGPARSAPQMRSGPLTASPPTGPLPTRLLPMRLLLAHLFQIGRAHVELQSLMRISYAVFCLKKKTHTNNSKQQIIFSTTRLQLSCT